MPALSLTRVVLQPDGEYLWAAGGGSSQSSVAAFRADSLEVAARLQVGKGSHELVVASDSRFVFVTNGEDDSISVIDTRSLKTVKDIQVGRGPVSAAYSELANAVYVSQTDAGSIAVIDAKNLNVIKTIQADPGACRNCGRAGRPICVRSKSQKRSRSNN